MTVTFGGIAIDFNLLSEEKAPFPIEVTESGRFISSKQCIFANA